MKLYKYFIRDSLKSEKYYTMLISLNHQLPAHLRLWGPYYQKNITACKFILSLQPDFLYFRRHKSLFESR